MFATSKDIDALFSSIRMLESNMASFNESLAILRNRVNCLEGQHHWVGYGSDPIKCTHCGKIRE